MITSKPTKEDFASWKAIWEEYRRKLTPNRKSGAELLEYLQKNYALTEISDKKSHDAVYYSVTENPPYAEKLPEGEKPVPKTFFLENSGAGEKFFLPENRDSAELWGGETERIFVGIDLNTGFFTVEGSTMLWDELCAFRGVDEKDLENYVIVADYVKSLKRFGKL